jgi:hypothetical protein
MSDASIGVKPSAKALNDKIVRNYPMDRNAVLYVDSNGDDVTYGDYCLAVLRNRHATRIARKVAKG